MLAFLFKTVVSMISYFGELVHATPVIKDSKH
jgi:hypothetical protein